MDTAVHTDTHIYIYDVILSSTDMCSCMMYMRMDIHVDADMIIHVHMCT
jgi:hypothetical protein